MISASIPAGLAMACSALGTNSAADSSTTRSTAPGIARRICETNGITNFPVIGQAFYDEGALSITGSLSAQPNLAYTIELYVSDGCHPSGYGEGARRVKTFSVTTDGAGFAFFDQAITISAPPAGSEPNT